MLWEIVKWYFVISGTLASVLIVRGLVMTFWPIGPNRAVGRKGDEDVWIRD